METKAMTSNEEYQSTVNEVLTHLTAALAAQERADAIEGSEHTQRQRAQVHPSHGVGASSIAKRWQGPPLAEVVSRMEREQKEVRDDQRA